MKLEGRVAVVTGAGSGIGRAISVALAREGARVGVNDVNAKGIEGTLEMLRGMGAQGLALRADVGRANDVRDMFATLAKSIGPVEILVNNAGIGIPGDWQDYKKFHDAAVMKVLRETIETGKMKESMRITSSFKDEWWLVTLNIHLTGTFYCTREALKFMEERRRGKIINMASVHGIHGNPGVPAYSAAKGGIIAFTKAVAQEVIGSGIIVNAIAPGYIDTPLLEGMDANMMKVILAQTPAGRMGRPEEIASLVVYLASSDGDYFVGQVLSPNGGMAILGSHGVRRLMWTFMERLRS